MILLAVVIGYILGVLPYIVPKVIEVINNNRVEEVEHTNNDRETAEIIDEWLNGPKEDKKVNQEDIYNEYVTGEVTPKGD